MDLVVSIRKAIDYIEEHLSENNVIDQVSNEVGISPLYLQTGFRFMTGYSIAEYIRNRKLYLAAVDIAYSKDKIIDIAFKYGYETPESFSKAFNKFHNQTPMQIRTNPKNINIFLPLKIKITIQGGNNMDFVIEEMGGFKVIGFERIFNFDNSYVEIPKFWSEVMQDYSNNKELFDRYSIGEFGVCLDDVDEKGKFRYIIAGVYKDGDIPSDMKIYEIPSSKWAKFRCVGLLPGAMQTINTKIFKEWLPNNPDFEISLGMNLEWYSAGDCTKSSYESGIWIPVKDKL